MTDNIEPIDISGLFSVRGLYFGDRAIFNSDNGVVLTQKELKFINLVMAKATLCAEGQSMKTTLWHKISFALGENDDS